MQRGTVHADKSSMNKTSSLYAVAVTLLMAGIVARIRAALENQAPVGYQDEGGFHFGAQTEHPAEN